MTHENTNPRVNNSGLPDPTAYEAIMRAEGPDTDEYEKFRKFINIVYKLCDICGYSLEEHIVLKDKETGRIWR